MPFLLVSLSYTRCSVTYAANKCHRKVRAYRLSQALCEQILQDLYAKGTGLLWSYSKEEFDRRVQVLMEHWHRLESSEHKDPQFVEYFFAIQTGRVKQIVASFPGRSLTWLSTSAPKSVGAKVTPPSVHETTQQYHPRLLWTTTTLHLKKLVTQLWSKEVCQTQ
ncbi:unnamed protein product [Porites evermanni]|uniref:Uncharacterized protein n=1 Tax=Porites evermanni TaxID=104178 RepID=A0ABN8S9S4_9CNID|nr:unnamed protein product [Porites evermanni]